MASNAAQWTVLGYDTRNILREWLGAWKDVLYGKDSPLLRWFDPCVVVRSQDGSQRVFQAGRETQLETAEFSAIELPSSIYLSRVIELPTSAEANLDAVMSLEVNAYSPFPPNETRFGWSVISRGKDQLRIGLLIASTIALAKQFEEKSIDVNPELWGFVESTPVLFHGFGERERRQRYLRNLGIAAGLVSFCGAMLLVICASMALTSASVLDVKSAQLTAINKSAQPALQLRDRLAVLETLQQRISELDSAHPPANTESARLTALMSDTAYLTDLTMEGREITIRGRASDATEVQQQLTSEAAYSSVSAPQSIRKLGDSDVFAFEIVLAEERAE